MTEDSSDYVSIGNSCPVSAVGMFQRFLQYRQSVDSIEPTGGPISGGTVVTIEGSGFTPIETPALSPPLLGSSTRCLWSCTPSPSNPAVCVEDGRTYASAITRPILVTPTQIVCSSPPRQLAGSIMVGIALNVYDTVGATCDDGLHNGDEADVDCGGSACQPCVPSCADGLMNGDETGVDCGGSSCPFCIPSCVTPNSNQQDCQLPTLSVVLPSSGPSEHAVLLTVHGSGFYKAGEVTPPRLDMCPHPTCRVPAQVAFWRGSTSRRCQVISYTKEVLGQPVLFTHNAMPRCTFSYGSDFRATPATVESSTTLKCRTPRAAIIGCYSLRVSLDVCDFDVAIQANCPSERLNSGASYSFIPKRQYPGYTTLGESYAYPGDYVCEATRTHDA